MNDKSFYNFISNNLKLKLMTAVEWLLNELIFKQEYEHLPNNYFLMSDKDIDNIIEQAKEMEKQQIIDSFGVGCHHESKRLVGYQDIAEHYYNETYGGKGSDDHIVDTNKMVDQVPDVRKMVDDDKETFLLWVRRNYERCKTGWIDLETGNKHRIEPDLVYEYYQLHPTSSQTEISDEEIEKFAEKFANDYAKVGVTENEVSAFFTGMKKYREQLKQRQ